MTRRLLAAALACTLAAVSVVYAAAPTKDHHEHAADAAPDNQAPEGWAALFNGENLDGWEVLSGKATYKVEGGAIVGTTEPGSPNTFLCTEKEYGDFELVFDVLLHDNQLNSGVQTRSHVVHEDQYGGRIGGPQVEIEAGPGQSGFIYGEASGGWLSPEPGDKDPAVNQHDHFKNGQWNHYRIVERGPRIQTWINGELIADLTVSDEYYENFKAGVIGLQVHGVGNAGPYRVRWKNIYIRELNADE